LAVLAIPYQAQGRVCTNGYDGDNCSSTVHHGASDRWGSVVEFTIVVIGLLLGAYLRFELRRIEARLCGPDDDAYDQRVRDGVIEATRSYADHRKTLEIKRKNLPGIDTWDISANREWGQQLIAKAEELRPLAEEAYGLTPDTPHFMRRAHQIPMTFNMAFARDFASGYIHQVHRLENQKDRAFRLDAKASDAACGDRGGRLGPARARARDERHGATS
jgi:hypothetical protein